MARILKDETATLRKCLVNKTIRHVECYHYAGTDSYVKLVTDKGSVIIGANDLARADSVVHG